MSDDLRTRIEEIVWDQTIHNGSPGDPENTSWEEAQDYSELSDLVYRTKHTTTRIMAALRTAQPAPNPSQGSSEGEPVAWLVDGIHHTGSKQTEMIFQDAAAVEALRKTGKVTVTPLYARPTDAEAADEDSMTMTCGHEGRYWSSVHKRCMECVEE